MSVKITEMERFMLECIADSQYQDGEPTVGHQIWIWDAHDNFQSQYSRRSTGGVMASLQKKGLVEISTYEKEDDCVAMTQDGYDALMASKSKTVVVRSTVDSAEEAILRSKRTRLSILLSELKAARKS